LLYAVRLSGDLAQEGRYSPEPLCALHFRRRGVVAGRHYDVCLRSSGGLLAVSGRPGRDARSRQAGSLKAAPRRGRGSTPVLGRVTSRRRRPVWWPGRMVVTGCRSGRRPRTSLCRAVSVARSLRA